MKITKTELKKIIREEALRFKKKLQLESELSEIEKELQEVEAGELYDAGETAGKKYKAEFEELDNKFGIEGETHTIKEEEVEEEVVEEEDEKSLEEMLAEIMAEEETEEEVEEEEIEEEELEEEYLAESDETIFDEECEVVKECDSVMEEGVLDFFKKDPKKEEEAKAIVKKEIEDTIKDSDAPEELKRKWLGSLDKLIKVAGEKYGYKVKALVAQKRGADRGVGAKEAGKWFITLKPAGPETKVGKFLAQMGAAAGSAQRQVGIHESESKENSTILEEQKRMKELAGLLK
jgi:hypothetical protein